MKELDTPSAQPRFPHGIGVFLPTLDPYGGALGNPGEAARIAEELGFDAVWTGDHIAYHSAILEPATSLAAAAATTTRVRLGFGILLLAMRPVALVAKQIATIQHISGDRLLLGVGVGGENPAEWEAVGVPLSQRAARTNRALEVLPALLRGEPVEASGTTGGTQIPGLRPTAPMPPVWVGGRVDGALRRAVRFGEAWLGLFADANRVRRSRERLAEIADELQRPVPAAALTVFVNVGSPASARDEAEVYMKKAYRLESSAVGRFLITGDEEQVTEGLLELAGSGVQGLMLLPAAQDVVGQYAALARVSERVRAGALLS